MQRIGITQRVEAIRGRGERRDALDQRWQAFFTTLGVLAVPLPNSAPSAELLLDELGLAGILLSGGNVEIWRNDSLVDTVPDSGLWIDYLKKGGTYTYEVCDAGGALCTPEAMVSF